MRTAVIKRKTKETAIEAYLDIDGSGKVEAATGIGFFAHMLVLLATHAFLDLTIKAEGALQVDSHHTIEDCGIVLGQALKQAVGSKAGMHRYGSCLLPMDEALALGALVFSGRPLLIWRAEIPKVLLGTMDAEMVEEFFRAIASESGMTLHVNILYGNTTHHIVEAIFKAFARALAEAVAIDGRVDGVMSSKGQL
jgi:imidazoleglycerol-phosphate dehydratase